MSIDNPATIADIENDVTVIKAVAGQAQLYETGDTITTTGAVQTLWVSETPSGLFIPAYLLIDFTNQTVTETVDIVIYYRITSGGGYIAFDSDPITAVQSHLGKVIEFLPNRYGIKVTIEKTAGTNRAYIWEVWYYA